jgi:hypothetical protein
MSQEPTLPSHFLPPAPENPLPKEHTYKLQMRCSNCLADAYPIACFGMKRLNALEVRLRIMEFAERLDMPCRECEGLSSTLVSFFPAKARGRLNG